MKHLLKTRPGIRIALLIVASCLLAAIHDAPAAAARIKDLTDIQGIQDRHLVGYSLVVGLDGTGDSRRSEITNQAVRNMMQKFGLNLQNDRSNLRNTASVMVTATVSPFYQPGSHVDVLVSSLGDAKSLEGGTLLPTPLGNRQGEICAYAQGPVSVGGFHVETDSGEKFRKNYGLVGRVPNGGIIESKKEFNLNAQTVLDLSLREPDFTSAVRIAEAVNAFFGQDRATAVDAGRVSIQLDESQDGVTTLASIENLQVETDEEAVVVINERTGTLVIGEHVTLAPVAIAHGNLSIHISSSPIVSQPPPFSSGQTVVVPRTQTQVVEEKGDRVAVVKSPASVEDLATVLNQLKLSPRDIIAIFQALKNAGSLKAKLVIM